ncbi:2-hydroxychromene-2-carboxylate isomerase [Vineibacter terrae]|uniref:2-hydroxychromene-2-carboxylate isomerase n=1 Tax=Vineibacter terrae TaxID=2586908 RepID=A0A5C8PK59_9HYPH|nr:2-hydroxychromene-2-carboxylate isomerase [Vineibacter terrae]TXL73778.1 2-hydroxychromene-2-carboxylate isomerase [Vineibacter terrae]
MPTLEFWYDFASPYSWMAAERIDGLAAAAGLAVRWRPFIIGPILRLRPDNPSPLQNAPPAQRAYRRRDVERLCARYGLPLRWPTSYPRNGLLGARLARAASPDIRPALSRAIYRANFVDDREISDATVIRDVVAAQGLDADALLAAALTDANKRGLVADVDAAIAHGIFGAPSFLIGPELFWGNDRLELAIAWAQQPWL